MLGIVSKIVELNEIKATHRSMSRRTLVRISSFSTSSAQSLILDTGPALSGVVKLDKNNFNCYFKSQIVKNVQFTSMLVLSDVILVSLKVVSVA